MAGQREKTLMLEEFVRNTGTDRGQALEILNRNKWNISNSYYEIEQMCISSARQPQGSVQYEGSSRQDTGSPHHKAIDMGLGAAVNLDSKTTNPISQTMSSSSKLPSYEQGRNSALSPDRHNPYPSHQQPQLSVNLPLAPTSNKQEHVVPIQSQRERTSPIQPYPSVYKPSYVGTPVDNSLRHTPNLNSPTSQSYNTQPSAHRGGFQRPRAVLNETVYPSHPSMVAPVSGKEVADAELHEEDDVFDDKHTRKPPPPSSYPRLKRGFSNILENESLVSEARYSVQADILKENHDNMYVQTFVLPDLTAHNEDFRAFLEKELIETSTLVSLEQAGRLNWWAELRLCQRLLPMATSGDGNCLLHAASLAMWGIHDRQLILRRELHETLTKAAYKDALYRRWRYQQTMSNKESGLVFSELEWKEEWENILRLASPTPRGVPDPSRSHNCCDSAITRGADEPVVYESLEEFHVFVLAHVLQRPIVIIADTFLKDSSGDALAPIPFPGIYLPVEVHPCYRSPLLLTYDAAHFSALSPMEQPTNASPKLPASIPLVDPEFKLLPLHFLVDPGPCMDWSKGTTILEPKVEDNIKLLQKLMDIEQIPFRLSDINGDSGSCGSQDSDESGTLVKDKDKKKEEKKKEARMSQQMQTVAKQFGSIGKSMGKKLKQLGKGGRGDKSRRPSVGNEITQSTRVISSYGNQNNGRDFILVANLSANPGIQQKNLVKNYLEDAKERFLLDRDLKRRSDIELKSRVLNSSSVCSTPGCYLYGSPKTNYLCSKCYMAQQRDANLSERAGGQFIYNTFPGRSKPAQSTVAPIEIFHYGKSKFYTSSNEDFEQAGDPGSLAVPNMDKQMSCSSSSVNIQQPRCPSPDYDNLQNNQHERDRHHYTQHQSSPQTEKKTEKKCRNIECDFFGSAQSNGYCSRCYKNNYIATTRVLHGITKL